MEIGDSVDQRRIAVERFFAVHHNILAEQGAVVTTYRNRGGRRLGPYYKLACRSNGRQVAVYLGVDDDLIGRVRERLAQLQQTRAERVRLGIVRRILRQHSKAVLTTTTFGSFLREFSPLWVREAKRCPNPGKRTAATLPRTTACPLTGAPFKPSARTGTHLRPIPSFDRRQLLMATGALQLWQRTARLAVRRACRAATFAAANRWGMSAPVPKYISSGVWP